MRAWPAPWLRSRPPWVGGLPPAVGVRAPLAAPCAPSRAYARRVPPSSGGQLTALKGAAILQRERMGDGHAPFRRSDRRRWRRFGRIPAHRPQGGSFTRAWILHTKICVQKKPPQMAGDDGSAKTRLICKTGEGTTLKCHQKRPPLTIGGQ